MKAAKLFLFILIPTVLTNCEFGPCEGCGECHYENFSTTGTIADRCYEGDTISQISFECKNGHEYWLHACNFPDVKMNFDPVMFREDSLKFIITGSHIIQGTCMPHSIEEIYLVE